jgi:hypothetical protein
VFPYDLLEPRPPRLRPRQWVPRLAPAAALMVDVPLVGAAAHTLADVVGGWRAVQAAGACTLDVLGQEDGDCGAVVVSCRPYG